MTRNTLRRIGRHAFAGALMLSAAFVAANGIARAAGNEAASPITTIEVAFVLDTTGSMADLIDGAKKKIWSIADEIRKSRPDARIRFAVIGYRDRGDVYVTDVTDLSDDLHGVYGKLVGFSADGGGDWPESVNEALNKAVTGLSWTREASTRRLVFLVGDAPPHMDYPQDVTFTDTTRIAQRDGIVINTVQAGPAEDTELAWRAIASLGNGTYVAIPQSGNMHVVDTPYDQDIQRLQLQLNLTVVPYGDEEQRSEVNGKLKMKAEAPAAAVSDMAGYEIRAAAPAERKVVTGAGDLVNDVLSGAVDLSSVAPEALPGEFKDLKPEEREAAIKAKIAEREKLQTDLARLVGERDTYLASEAAKAPEGADDSFDGAVNEMIARQLK